MTQDWTRRSFVSLAAASAVATHLPAAETASSPLLYIGSTTRKPGDGIHVARWNAGALTDIRLAFEATAPSFLAATRHRKAPLLFAGHQVAPRTGGLSGFHIDPSGSLKLINTVSVPGSDFVHLALDHTE